MDIEKLRRVTIVIPEIYDIKLEVLSAGLGQPKRQSVMEALEDYFSKKELELSKALKNLNNTINKKRTD